MNDINLLPETSFGLSWNIIQKMWILLREEATTKPKQMIVMK